MEAMNFINVKKAETHVREEQNSAENSNKSQVGIEDEECRSKKLKKQSSNCNKVKGERYLCKQCEKGFKSPQAVFGHMRCHSISNIHTNAKKKGKSEVPRKKRTLGRYKINPASSYTSWSYLNNSSSSLTLVNDDELEDIAVSLLMLANSRRWSHSYSDDDSVKLDSAIQQCDFDNMDFANDHGDLEPGFPTVKQCGLFHPIQPAPADDSVTENASVSVQSGSNIVRCFDSVKDRNEDSLTNLDIPSELCDADMRDEQVQVEIVHTTDSLNPTSYAPAAENPKFEVDIQSSGHNTEHQFELFDSEIRTADTMVDSLSPKSCHLPVEQRKVVDQVSHRCDSGTQTDDGPAIRDSVCFKEYICRVCNRRFLSHQALGGHRLHCPPKKKSYQARAIATDISNNVVSQDDSNKKRWAHKCLMCCKVFSSGQALGGHMRAHFNTHV